ncbi:MAG: 23S rRNA (uracil(1939)-C(5))-methyltransferase RlmD [Lachnospiraceae bacterium]|nr:23S rRNA (uracil(1939)-C(5))-methyltransferase RlmD [Lachnospiraceae bacterium]
MNFKKNDVVTVTIEDMGQDGEGIGKVEGFTLFIKDAVIGDVVEAKLMKVKKNYGYARLMKLVTPSPYRVEPKCPVYRQCGGCQIQALDYQEQLKFKERKVRGNLERIGGFKHIPMEPIMGMDMPYYYRNKAQFPVGTDKNGQIITGFYAGRTHDIIPNTKCYLGVSVNEEILNVVLEFMKKYHVTAYDEATGKGLVRHVLIRVGFTSKEIMVSLVVNGRKLPHSEELVEELVKIQGMTSITLNVNTKKTNVILGDEVILLWGETYIKDNIGDIVYQISPLSFYQVNPVQTKKLYETALEYAGLKGQETVWDLYCGIGTISLFLAQKAKQVYGVEIVPQAIEDAKRNAKLNGIENAEFYVGKAEEVLPELYEKEGIYADVIVVDPPRKGCDEKCLETIVKMKPERVVYVSCDSATLARDLKYLCGEGYEVTRVRGCDMFPMTGHVETVCLLSKLHEAKHHINVKVDMDELDLTSAEAKATYKEIEEWVQEHYGFHVTNLNIAQVKQKHGIIKRENYNKPKSENSRQPGCPEEKIKAIEDAMRHFQMI